MVGAATGSVAGGAKVTSGNGRAPVEDDAEGDIKGTEVKGKGDGRGPSLEQFTLRPKRNNSAQCHSTANSSFCTKCVVTKGQESLGLKHQSGYYCKVPLKHPPSGA